MAVGALALVEGVRQISGVESTQTVLGLTIVGFATAFELVVLAWSTGRRGMSEAVVAAVIGSYAYNATMTLGAGALARPLSLLDARTPYFPWALCSWPSPLSSLRGGGAPRSDRRPHPHRLLPALRPGRRALGVTLFIASTLTRLFTRLEDLATVRQR